MAESGGNPFRPGRGVMPPLLAGRDSELAEAERLLDRLREGRSPSQDLLFYGPRGNGKTTLLLELERRAGERGFRVETLPVTALTEKRTSIRLLQERSGVLEMQITGVQFAGTGGTAVPRPPTEDLDALLWEWIGGDLSLPPLVIVLDEVQALVPECARWFFEAVQRAKSKPAPFLVLAAGTPDAPRRLRQAGTFNERGFRRFRVGRLDRSATMAALREPALESGRPFTNEAAAFLAEESQDYPYFIQLLGSAAWEAGAGADAGISLREARQSGAECAPPIEEFYRERYREAEARRVESVLKPLSTLLEEHGGSLGDAQLRPLLRRFGADDSIPFDDLSLRDELSDLGVLWEVRPYVWEMGIPSFADYLLRHG